MAIEFGSPEARAIVQANRRLEEQEEAKLSLERKVAELGIKASGLKWYRVYGRQDVQCLVVATSEREAERRADTDDDGWSDCGRVDVSSGSAREDQGRKLPESELEYYAEWKEANP